MNESDWVNTSAPEIGVNSVFERRFRIVRKLGTGGMSTVYEAEDICVRRIVAREAQAAG